LFVITTFHDAASLFNYLAVYFRSLKSTRVEIHKNLHISLLMYLILFVAWKNGVITNEEVLVQKPVSILSKISLLIMSDHIYTNNDIDVLSLNADNSAFSLQKVVVRWASCFHELFAVDKILLGILRKLLPSHYFGLPIQPNLLSF